MKKTTEIKESEARPEQLPAMRKGMARRLARLVPSFRLTLVYPDGEEEFVGDFRGMIEARQAYRYRETLKSAARGRVDALFGQDACQWIYPNQTTPIPRSSGTKRRDAGKHQRVQLVGRQKPITAWGETKTVEEWARDERARVTFPTIRIRLSYPEKWTPESAIGTPLFNGQVPKPKKEPEIFRGFGEEKTLAEWANDPRCEVSKPVLKARIRQGAPLESALGGGKGYPGFGEEKTILKWSKDARCPLSVRELHRALRYGKSIEQAFADAKLTQIPELYKAFGEKKSLEDWANDPRCKTPLRKLRFLLERGAPFEEAINFGYPPPQPPIHYQAFGESKTLYEWAMDYRCRTTLPVLRRRLEEGASLEDALSRR